MADFSGRVFEMPMNGSHFSAREEKILQLLLVGSANREIARELDINVETVKADMRQILRKLKARSEMPRSVDAQRLATH
jgi:DNA-binding NarL/FixJ family response regulator